MVLEKYPMFNLLDEFEPILEKFLKDLPGSITAILNLDYQISKSKEKAL